MEKIKINQFELEDFLLDYHRKSLEQPKMAKGLFLFGQPGIGKTYSLRRFKTNLASFLPYSTDGVFTDSYELTDLILLKGIDGFLDFCNDRSYIWIDDIGSETLKISSFGTDYYPLVRFMNIKYDIFVQMKERINSLNPPAKDNLKYSNTAKINFISNHSPENLQSWYGERFYSRLQECCEFVYVEGNSLRQ